MNNILRWAKEADLWMTSDERIAAVERFAALAQADEREHCAKIVEHYCGAWSDEGHALANAIRTRSKQ